ncbi:MAG TPA: GumC family protein [Xanthobacteraceae bacterium]|nr:GumC family protein [Xanthobacteraceae bacterium]
MFLDPKSKDHGNVIRAVPAPASSAQEREARTRQAHEPPWAFVRRNKTYPLLGVLAALLVALIVETFVTPRYRATIEILIGPADLRLVEKSVLPASQASDANVMQVESETRILTSDRVLRRVVRGEHLVDDPEFQMRGGGGRFDGIVNALRSIVGKPLEQVKIADRELDALRLLQRKISAKRTERTYVVDLTVDSSDPEKSARIANAIGIAYTDEQAYARAETARRATESLSSRLNEQRDRVSQAEEQVERYKAQHNIVDASGRLVDEQQLSELNNQLIAARGRSAEAKARYDQMLQLRRSGLDQGSIPEAVQSSTLGLLRDQYGTIARQEANLTAELGPRHPSVIEARAQLRNAQQQIADEIARIAEASRIAYERAQAHETTLATNFALLKQRAMDTSLAFVKLRELEREAEASRAVYESFLVRTREIREQERLDTANVRILADAQAPEGRSFPPRRVLLLPALLVLGLVGGIGLAYLLELARRQRPANDADDRSERALTDVTSTVPAE